MLLFFRCTTFIGVCVEFVAAVAWLAELFTEPKRREAVLGYTQAFSSLGGFMVSVVYTLISTYGNNLPAIYGGHEPWRYTLISGLIPAIPLIVIRPFLPESPAWQAKKTAGTLRRPSIAALFSPELKRTTIVTTLMFACSYGAAFGAIQQMPQIVPGLPEVQPLPPPARQATVGTVQTIQELGGLVGRFLLAFLAIRIISRRKLLRIFQIPGIILMPLIFIYPATSSLTGSEIWNLRCRFADSRAIQLLGKLPAARISDPPSWNRRGLCSEYRRANDRNGRRAVDHATGCNNARNHARCSSCICGGSGCLSGLRRRLRLELLPSRTATRSPARMMNLRTPL